MVQEKASQQPFQLQATHHLDLPHLRWSQDNQQGGHWWQQCLLSRHLNCGGYISISSINCSRCCNFGKLLLSLDKSSFKQISVLLIIVSTVLFRIISLAKASISFNQM